MKKGATTILDKPCDSHELYDSIREALRRSQTIQDSMAARQSIEQRISSLTADERQILDCIVEGTSNKAIANELDVSMRTVETRRQQVFEKMQADSVAELVRLVLNVLPQFGPL